MSTDTEVRRLLPVGKSFYVKTFSDKRCAASRAFARQNPLSADFMSKVVITRFHTLSSLDTLLFPPYYAKISVEGNLGRQAVKFISRKCASTLKGGGAVYITLDNLIQIGIFLTGFTVVIISILSFNKKK